MSIATVGSVITALRSATPVANLSYDIATALTIGSTGLRIRVHGCISRSEIANYGAGTITWNGTALTKIPNETTGGAGEWNVGWELRNPTPGTGNLTITNGTNTKDGTFWVIVENGTNNSLAAVGTAYENGAATSATPAATVAAGASAICCGTSFTYTAATPGALVGTLIGASEASRHCVQAIGAVPSIGNWSPSNQVGAFTSVVQAAPAVPVITGPTGSAGASSITTTSAELQNVAGVWTATDSGTWSISGTDAALLAISGGTVTKLSGNFDFETKASYSFNVVNGSASQAVTLNISDINEPPAFIGPAIGALVLTQGFAMTPVPIAAKFVDPEGLTITGTVVESLPPGLSVVSGVLQGAPTTVQASATYTPRGADPAANATNGTQFTITVNAPVPALNAPTASATGTTTATAAFTTDLTGGNAFFLRRTGTTPASQATVAATGESQAVTAAGVQTRNMTAFASGTPFYVDMTQSGAVVVVSAGPFTPSTLTASGSPSAQSGVASAAFTWGGSTPASLVSGGIGTKTWSMPTADGSGLSSINSSTGVPAGTLTATPGTYHPILRVTDSSTAGINPTGGGAPPQTVDFSLTLIVGASGSATAIVISNASPAAGQVGQPSNDFTVGANGTITGTVAVTPSEGAGGGTFTPSSVNISSGSPTATFKYTPASVGAKSITVANNGGLTNPGAVTYTATSALATTLSVTLTTDGITPIPNLTGLKVAVYDQPTPDLWAGHTPIYVTASGTTDGSGVFSCSIAGLTTLVPGGLAGLSISNSDGTTTQGAAQRGYVGPAVVA